MVATFDAAHNSPMKTTDRKIHSQPRVLATQPENITQTIEGIPALECTGYALKRVTSFTARENQKIMKGNGEKGNVNATISSPNSVATLLQPFLLNKLPV